VARIECCSAFDVARDGRVRLDGDWSGDQSMRSTSPPWVWVALVLALLMISYVVARKLSPPSGPTMAKPPGERAASWRGIDDTAFGRSFCLIPRCGIEVWLTSVRGRGQ
jgi:hypothetical protein